jgi:hypothetical protein
MNVSELQALTQKFADAFDRRNMGRFGLKLDPIPWLRRRAAKERAEIDLGVILELSVLKGGLFGRRRLRKIDVPRELCIL